MGTLYFYRTTDPYGEFSNFAAFPFVLDGVEWPTSEHYFQAQKFAGTDHVEQIRAIVSPMDAANAARSRQRPLRPDWGDVRVDVMRRALTAKFDAHTSLQRLLLSTGDDEIVEHTANDSFWADGGDGSGQNMLGLLLMDLRRELREAAANGY